MTTKVKITNESTNTASDRHNVGVAILQSPDNVQVSARLLKPGESEEFYVYAGQQLRVMEISATAAEKPAQGIQN